MARPRFLSQFVASVIDNNTAVTQFRIADNGIGVLRQPQIEVDELLNMDLFVPATDTTSGAGTFNQSLLDKANHREETGNYLVIVKTDNPCHIAVSNGLNYGDAWNQTSGVYNDLIKSTDALDGGWGFLNYLINATNYFLLPIPDLISNTYAKALLTGVYVRLYKYTDATGLYSALNLNGIGLAASIYTDASNANGIVGLQVMSDRLYAYPDNSPKGLDVTTQAYIAAASTWAADDRIAYSIEPITRLYGNMLVMKCDNPINLSIVNTSALDIAGKVYLLKVIDELE
jgi:hypothetical protein